MNKPLVLENKIVHKRLDVFCHFFATETQHVYWVEDGPGLALLLPLIKVTLMNLLVYKRRL